MTMCVNALSIYCQYHQLINFSSDTWKRVFTRDSPKNFLPVLLEKYNIPPQNAYMWNLYTDQDLSHENSLNKYEDRSTKGFYQMMYKNTNSAGNLLGRVKHQLDPLHSLVYAQKKNTRPNVATDK